MASVLLRIVHSQKSCGRMDGDGRSEEETLVIEPTPPLPHKEAPRCRAMLVIDGTEVSVDESYRSPSSVLLSVGPASG